MRSAGSAAIFSIRVLASAGMSVPSRRQLGAFYKHSSPLPIPRLLRGMPGKEVNAPLSSKAQWRLGGAERRVEDRVFRGLRHFRLVRFAVPYGAIVVPPSTMIVWPVMKAPAREASIRATPAMSSGSPRRRNGVAASRAARRCGSS